MASVRSQRPDDTTNSKNLAAAAVNVPQLRDAVTVLTDAVARLDAEIARLRKEHRRSSG